MNIAFINTISAFNSLTNKEKRELLNYSCEMVVKKGRIFVHEGMIDERVFIIIDGEIEVIKRLEGTDNEYVLTSLKSGDISGEMSILNSGERSASLRAKVDSKLLVIDFIKLKNNSVLYNKMIKNFAGILSGRLRNTNQVAVEAMQHELENYKTRVSMGKLLLGIIYVFSLYIILTHSINFFLLKVVSSSVILSFIINMLLCLVLLIVIKGFKYPLEYFGLTLKNWRKYTWQAIIYTIPVVFLLFFLKTIVVYYGLSIPYIPNDNIISVDKIIKSSLFHGSLPLYISGFVIYLIGVPLQEISARCALQSPLQYFLGSSPKNTWLAIITANLIFVTAHTHLNSTPLLLMVFISGLYWGWLYNKQRSIVGVTVSHAIIGSLVFYVLMG